MVEGQGPGVGRKGVADIYENATDGLREERWTRGGWVSLGGGAAGYLGNLARPNIDDIIVGEQQVHGNRKAMV